MVRYTDKKISEFLEALGSRAPVPGGGSAAALVGAIGASLLGMVTHFTIGRKGHEKLTAELKKTLFESHRLRERLSRLVDEDIESYLEVSRAQRAAKLLAKRESREKLLRAALRKALASSLSICKVSHRGVLLSKKLVQTGNKNLKSDAKAAAFFFSASFYAASLMSEANVRWLEDDTLSKRAERVLLPLRKKVEKIVEEIQRET